MDYMRKRFLERILFDVDSSGGAGTAVIAPGTPAPFQHGAADGDITPPPGSVTITDTQHAAPGTPGATFTADQLEAARRQEKDKLYPQLQEAQTRLGELERERDERLRLEQEARDAADLAERQAAQADMDAKQLIEAKSREWEAERDELRRQIETTNAVITRERTHSELQSHRFAVMQAAQEDILPQFIDLVTGNSIDEINASAEMLKQKSASVLADMNAVTQTARQGMQGTTATAPSTGPLDTVTSQQTFSPDDIANMDEATYAKYRNQLLPAAREDAFRRR